MRFTRLLFTYSAFIGASVSHPDDSLSDLEAQPVSGVRLGATDRQEEAHVVTDSLSLERQSSGPSESSVLDSSRPQSSEGVRIIQNPLSSAQTQITSVADAQSFLRVQGFAIETPPVVQNRRIRSRPQTDDPKTFLAWFAMFLLSPKGLYMISLIALSFALLLTESYNLSVGVFFLGMFSFAIFQVLYWIVCPTLRTWYHPYSGTRV